MAWLKKTACRVQQSYQSGCGRKSSIEDKSSRHLPTAAVEASDHSGTSSRDSGTWVFKPLSPGSIGLNRQSLPAVKLQESIGIMTNPPVFHNPLRRRGCCDHSYSTELTNYRAEAIKRDLLAQEQVEQQRRRVQSLNDLQAVA